MCRPGLFYHIPKYVLGACGIGQYMAMECLAYFGKRSTESMTLPWKVDF